MTRVHLQHNLKICRAKLHLGGLLAIATIKMIETRSSLHVGGRLATRIKNKKANPVKSTLVGPKRFGPRYMWVIDLQLEQE